MRPVIKKMKEEEKKRFRDKIKKQRNKTGIKIKRKAKGANPLSRIKGKKGEKVNKCFDALINKCRVAKRNRLVHKKAFFRILFVNLL